MILFWTLAAAMVLVALAFVLPPLLGRGRASGEVRRELNVAIFRERVDELDEDLREGAISDEQYREARGELERDLLVDTENVGGSSASAVGAPARKGRWAAVLVAVAVPAVAVGLYWNLGAQGLIARGTPARNGAASIETMVAQLAKRLEKTPDDAKGWVMLGRSYLVLQRYPDAVKAYKHARALVGDNPDLLADYAEALSMANGGGRMAGEPLALVENALAQDPKNAKALWLAGIGHYQRGDRAGALERWHRLLALLPAKSENARMVTATIQRVEGQGAAAGAAPSATPATGTGTVQVHVELAADLRSKAAPDDTVFIFARAPQGPPAPLAVVRMKVSDLPTTVTLNDSQAMMATMKLSLHKQVLVGARVSKSGNPIAQAGDLQGTVSGVTVGDGKTVRLTIDHQTM